MEINIINNFGGQVIKNAKEMRFENGQWKITSDDNVIQKSSQLLFNPEEDKFVKNIRNFYEQVVNFEDPKAASNALKKAYTDGMELPGKFATVLAQTLQSGEELQKRLLEQKDENSLQIVEKVGQNLRHAFEDNAELINQFKEKFASLYNSTNPVRSRAQFFAKFRNKEIIKFL